MPHTKHGTAVLSEEIRSADVLVVQWAPTDGSDLLASYTPIVHRLQQAKLRVVVYPEPIAVAQQVQYANRQGIPLAILGGPKTWAQGVVHPSFWRVHTVLLGGREYPKGWKQSLGQQGMWQVKDLDTSVSSVVEEEELLFFLQDRLYSKGLLSTDGDPL